MGIGETLRKLVLARLLPARANSIYRFRDSFSPLLSFFEFSNL